MIVSSLSIKRGKSEARAYRIWCAANALEWDLTVKQLSEEVGINENTVRRVCQLRGWLSRLRADVKPFRGLDYRAEMNRPLLDVPEMIVGR